MKAVPVSRIVLSMICLAIVERERVCEKKLYSMFYSLDSRPHIYTCRKEKNVAEVMQGMRVMQVNTERNRVISRALCVYIRGCSQLAALESEREKAT